MDKILKRMGYRKMNAEIWGKPFSYQLLLAKQDSSGWKVSNYFKGADGKIHIWDTAEFTDLESLMSVETSIIYIVGGGLVGDFSFLNPEDMFDL